MTIFSMTIFICSYNLDHMTISSMTSALVQKLACQLLNKYTRYRQNCHTKIARVNGLACKLGTFFSSPDRSIPLFSLFSFLEILLVSRTVEIVIESFNWFTSASVIDNDKLGNETGSPSTRASKRVIKVS